MTKNQADDHLNPHRLELIDVELVGGDREVHFKPGFNIIFGEITSGKTTLVRLIRAMFGPMPKQLPPEVDALKAIRGRFDIGSRRWTVYRPRTTTSSAKVEISEERESRQASNALRLPVAAAGQSYSTFLLEEAALPAVDVPRARRDSGGALSPVTMADWLGYSIVTGDDIDTQVFGHHDDWRDAKRRWVFELAYGYYDPELARLNAQLRGIELRLASFEQEAEIRRRFLTETPFANADDLVQQVADRRAELAELMASRRKLVTATDDVSGVRVLREKLLSARTEQAEFTSRRSRLEAQVKDLQDLRRQLTSQSSKLTRAIVADELLVDFDFIVCPRCGNDVDSDRADPHLCYLCLQPPRPAQSSDELLAEQDRIASQIAETDDVITHRIKALRSTERDAAAVDQVSARLARELDETTASFVSDQATRIAGHAARQARLEAEITRLDEYRQVVWRYQESLRARNKLEAEASDIRSQIASISLNQVDAESNVRALQERMLDYLRKLRIPDLGQDVTVQINRTTYLPEVSGRTFDRLSSQGLKTLVNIAHALAHHTVAIDRGLPLPGLLILDGLSSNTGQEGFDLDRVKDAYRLLSTEAERYRGALQVIAVDNELSREIILGYQTDVVLTLSQRNRLIRPRHN